MSRRPREKKPAWKHFTIINKQDDNHPHIKCNYCSKEFKRAVPERMQTHLDDICTNAPDDAKSKVKQLNYISEEKQKTLVYLLAKALSSTKVPSSFVDSPHVIELFRQLQPSFKLPNREEIDKTNNNNDQLCCQQNDNAYKIFVCSYCYNLNYLN